MYRVFLLTVLGAAALAGALWQERPAEAACGGVNACMSVDADIYASGVQNEIAVPTGDPFKVALTASSLGATGAVGYQYQVSFDDAALDFVSAQDCHQYAPAADCPATHKATLCALPTPTWTNGDDEVTAQGAGCTSPGPNYLLEGQRLVVLTLQCVQGGATTVHLVTETEDPPFGSMFLQNGGSTTPTDTTDAVVTCGGVPNPRTRMAIDANPATAALEQMAVVSAFQAAWSAPLNVYDAQVPYAGYQWDVEWDNSLVELLSITEQASSTGFTLCAPPELQYHANGPYRAGTGAGCVSETGDATTFIGATTVFQFRCKAAGTTNIQLHGSATSIFPTTTIAQDGSVIPTWLIGGSVTCSDTLNLDQDGCSDKEESGTNRRLGGMRDIEMPWDFFDVPIPALNPTDATGTRNKLVTLGDVTAILYYIGTAPALGVNVRGVSYNSDVNADGIADGLAYDRTPSANASEPWRSRAPNGAVTLQDAQVALAQVGDECTAPP